jgi:hypothetical protein
MFESESKQLQAIIYILKNGCAVETSSFVFINSSAQLKQTRLHL